jgi:hypothetical protein
MVCQIQFIPQKGPLPAGLVLAQLLAIILLGVLAYLLALGVRRCWRKMEAILQPKTKSETEEGCENSTGTSNDNNSKEAIFV